MAHAAGDLNFLGKEISRLGHLSAEALACKSLISRLGPVITEVPYEP
jgi:hypothetical protein